MTEIFAFCSPVDLLASSFLNSRHSADIPLGESALALVCGDIGVGKTTWCRRLVERAQLQGLPAAGILSPAVFTNSIKVGIELLDLSSGERRPMARRRLPDELPCAITGALNWIFEAQSLSWGNDILRRLLDANGAPAPELLVLDELGPLEFISHRGLTAGFELIEARRFRLACMTIRPGLLPAALERWPWAHTIYLDRPAEAM